MLRKKFKPAQLAGQVLDTNPDQNQKTLAKNVHTVVSEEEEQQLMEKLLSLPRQGEIVQHFEGNAASWWAKSIGQLPPELLWTHCPPTATSISGVKGPRPSAHSVRNVDRLYFKSLMLAPKR